MYKIKIPFTPGAKASVRLGNYGFYNPTAKGMNTLRIFIANQIIGPPFTRPVFVITHFRLAAPVSVKGQKRLRQNEVPHGKKPDKDNLEKFFNDALKGVVWRDDCLVSWSLISKTVTSDKQGSTIFYVAEMPEGPSDYAWLLERIAQNIRIECDIGG